MPILRQLGRAFRRSALIRNIEVARGRLARAPEGEKIRYELELMAYRQQIRLLDSLADSRNPLDPSRQTRGVGRFRWPALRLQIPGLVR